MTIEGISAVLVVAATVGLFRAWSAIARGPGRRSAMLRERTWLRAMSWTAGVVAAASLGSFAAGGDDVLAVAVAIGCVALLIEGAMWALARAFPAD